MPDRTGAGTSPASRRTCHWAQSGILARYHDEEWGVPVHRVHLAIHRRENAETRAARPKGRTRANRGIRPTICYAFMQATGMVNDHLRSCFRWVEI